MKLFVLLALQLVHEGAYTHLETCECHEIRELVSATVQQAAASLEYKLSLIIDTAISNINITDEAARVLERSLISTMTRLIKPIQAQLDYHLPLPPPPLPSEDPFPPLTAEDNPARSCRALHDRNPDAPSDYYWIGKAGSPALKMYCDMTRTCGNLTGGWMRVANINMTNISQQCPSGLTLISSPKRLCDVTHSNHCNSNSFSTQGGEYTHVCGRVIGYQNHVPVAFHYGYSFDAPYLYGVSLTHGQNPRKHIWTFAGASDESTYRPSLKCPCSNTAISPQPRTPSYIGNDYFCDTALSVRYNSVPRVLQTSKPLWDGDGCGYFDTCCSFPGGTSTPPWFAKDLPSPTADDIEMRVCRPDTDGSTPIEIVELYVQ